MTVLLSPSNGPTYPGELLPDDHLLVELEYGAQEDERTICVTPLGERSKAVVRKLD